MENYVSEMYIFTVDKFILFDRYMSFVSNYCITSVAIIVISLCIMFCVQTYNASA
jgi:hypothetical protein